MFLQELSLSESTSISSTNEVQISKTKSSDDNTETTETIQTITSTTTITTVTTSTATTTKSLSGSDDDNGEDDEPPKKMSKLDDKVLEKGVDDSGDKSSDSNNLDSKSEKDNKLILSTKSVLAEAIKASQDGKPKVINLQSLLPAARQSLLSMVDKNKDDLKCDPNSKTVLVVNREGGKVTLQVQRQPLSDEDGSGDSSSNNGNSTGKILYFRNLNIDFENKC